MVIYQEVGTRFREISKKRGEHLSAGSMNMIVFKFLNVYEKMGRDVYDSHLVHELELYERDGLREDYKHELKLF